MISLNIRKPCSRVLWVPGSVCCQQGRPEQKKIHQLLTVDEWQRVLQTEWESQGEWEKGWDRGVALFCRYHCSLYCFSIRHTVSWIILPTRFMTPIKWLLQGKLRVFNSLRSMYVSTFLFFYLLLLTTPSMSVHYQPTLPFTDSCDVCDGLSWLCRARTPVNSPVSSQPSSSSSLHSLPPDKNTLQHEKISHLRFLAQSFRFLQTRLR